MIPIKEVEIRTIIKKLDTSFTQENPEFITACNNVNWKDINTLNVVLQYIDKLIQKYPKPNETIREVLTTIPRIFVEKYPFLFGYWKKITAIEYQLNGLENSVNALATSVEKFPQSLELWCDYIKVLIANYPKDIEKIRSTLQTAKGLIGWQFYSHVFWDIYIDFETKQGSDLRPIYEEIIQIPLHQYAKYVKPYKQLLKDPKDLKTLQVRVKNNQIIVGEIWRYESKIKQNFFNLTPLPQTELDNWNQYIDFLLKSKKPSTLIQSVFERCLIPCCHIQELWIRYINWFSSIKTKDEVIKLYKFGINLLPIDNRSLRYQFLEYLKTEIRKTEEAESLFETYSKEVLLMMSHWYKETLTSCKLLTEYLRLLKTHKFNSKLTDTPKTILSKQTGYSKYLDTTITNYLASKEAVDDLGNLLCEENLSMVVVELIKVTWLVVKNNVQTRKYFNFFGKVPSIKNSTPFWLTYYKFEKQSKNFVKLNKFINDLGIDICLPVDIINDIIKDYKTFYLLNSNAIDFRQHENKNDSKNNSQVLDPILYSQFKINKPKWVPGKSKRVSSNDWYKNVEFKQNGHPGILVERPSIKNPLIEYPTKKLKNTVPGIPTFRNLEKINQPPKYIDYYTDEYALNEDLKN